MTRMRRERIPIDPIAFGRILKTVRQEQGMSQQDLAFAMTLIWRRRMESAKAISLNWVRLAERGDLKSVDRYRIACAAEALHVPVTQLLPPASSEPEESSAKTPVDLVVAFRRYGISDADIETLLPLIREFTEGNDAVRMIVENIRIPTHKDIPDNDS